MKRILILAGLALALVPATASAHFTYTWPVAQASLYDTNLDRACGWSAGQHCREDSMRAQWAAWVGEHSVKARITWTQYDHCLPGCDVNDYCQAVVRVVDHNEGGRVNIKQVYSWERKESSCVVPVSVVP